MSPDLPVPPITPETAPLGCRRVRFHPRTLCPSERRRAGGTVVLGRERG